MSETALVAESKATAPKRWGRAGGFGRQKGTPNKTTAEMKVALKMFLTDPRYQNNLMDRIEAGRADHMEKYFWETLYGRPKVVVELEAPESPVRSLAEAMRRSLTKEERLTMYELMKRATEGGVVIDVKALPASKDRRESPRRKAKVKAVTS